MSGWINLSHIVVNPRDKEHANETLCILCAKGYALEPNEIKSREIVNGWKPGAADELAKLAEKTVALKARPSTKAFQNADGKYNCWSK